MEAPTPAWTKWETGEHYMFPMVIRELDRDGQPKLGPPPYDEVPWREGGAHLFKHHLNENPAVAQESWKLSAWLGYGNGPSTLDERIEEEDLGTPDLATAKRRAQPLLDKLLSDVLAQIEQEFCPVCGYRLDPDLDADKPGAMKPCRICELNAQIAASRQSQQNQ